MDLDSLLKANLELKQRVAADQRLRRYLSRLWAETTPLEPERAVNHSHPSAPGFRSLTFSLPLEMCELLAREAEQAGKTPAQILEDAFADWFQRKHSTPAKPKITGR